MGGIAASTSSSLARALNLTSQYGNNLLIRHQADWVNGWLIDNWCWGEEGNNLRLGWNLVEKNWPNTFNTLPWLNALPQIVSSGSVLAELSSINAKSLGLPENILLIAGTTDSNAAVLSTDATSHDGITILGSTIVLKHFVKQPIKGIGVTNHIVGGQWLCGGASNAGGAVLRRFFKDKELKELSRQINPELDSGLMFRPLPFKGERFPSNNPNLEPILDPRPISDSLYLHGILEGLAQIEVDGWEYLKSIGVPFPKKVITLGGGAQNPQWRRIRERKLGIPVITSKEPPALGTARLALQGISREGRLKPFKRKSRLP